MELMLKKLNADEVILCHKQVVTSDQLEIETKKRYYN